MSKTKEIVVLDDIQTLLNQKRQYEKVEVKIKGLTPLLMNKRNKDSESLNIRSTVKKKYTAENDAKKSRYVTLVDGEEQLYIPSEAIYRMMLNTATPYRLPNRQSLASTMAGSIRIEPDKVLLGLSGDEYVVDERFVRIQNASVPHGRARIENWGVTFTIIYEKSMDV